MSSGLDSQKLSAVFKSRPDILKGIQKEADTPSRVKLFNDIVNYVYEQTGGELAAAEEQPALKRRRVDIDQNGSTASSSNGAAAPSVDVASEDVLLEIKDISVSIPQRKKFDLCFTAHHIYAKAPNTTAPIPTITYAWKDFEYVFCLPVPEKAQVQYNYVLLPRGSALASLSKDSPSTAAEPLVFTIGATAPKPGSIGGKNASAAQAVSDSYKQLFTWAIKMCLNARAPNVQIEEADPSKFHSNVRQAHRPKEKAVHVAAHRGSKDGFLFFLENGILWAFKKPLLFIPVDRIAAISYTSVLQRTFNMVVEIFTKEGGDEEATEEVEFAMLDQEDYNGISENYVMRKGLQDRSMADQRKAKKELAENGKGKKGADAENGDEDDATAPGVGLAELQKTDLWGDDDEEDEEDYDPGSDGESEGSGSDDDDSDDDDDDDDAGEDGEDDEMDGAAEDED
ncbi:hypothetical protein E8E14_004249 [Neopestalotiopsis sp. 37M]|nr:hypothetical protein E8E14_004249 [Neopestalotiopsis sp. 37M]